MANPLFLQSSDGISDGLGSDFGESGVNAGKQHQPQNLQLPQAAPGPKAISPQMTTAALNSSHTHSCTDSHGFSSTETVQGWCCSPAASRCPVQPQQLLPGQRQEEYDGGMETNSSQNSHGLAEGLSNLPQQVKMC